MANRRMISSDIWRDEFVGELDLFGRIMWIGLIVTCADDQGRLPNNPRLIRSDIFPIDEDVTGAIEKCIEVFSAAGKIIVYEAEGKSIIQILNWWQYQTPSWAAPSKYAPPPGWTDRVKIHGKGTTVITQNWDCTGGYIPNGIPNQLPSPLPKGINDVNGNGKGEIKGEGEVNVSTPFEPDPIQALVETITGLPVTGIDGLKAVDEIRDLGASEDDIKAGYAWLIKNGKVYKYPGQLIGPVRTAQAKRVQSGNGNAKRTRRVLTGPGGEQIEEEL